MVWPWWFVCCDGMALMVCVFSSTLSTAPCLGWSPAWWAALPDCTRRPAPPAGRRSPRPAAATAALLCTLRATPRPATSTPRWARGGTPSTNTPSISLDLLTSTERPPPGGPSSQPAHRSYSGQPIIGWQVWTQPSPSLPEGTQSIEWWNGGTGLPFTDVSHQSTKWLWCSLYCSLYDEKNIIYSLKHIYIVRTGTGIIQQVQCFCQAVPLCSVRNVQLWWRFLVPVCTSPRPHASILCSVISTVYPTGTQPLSVYIYIHIYICIYTHLYPSRMCALTSWRMVITVAFCLPLGTFLYNI